MWLGKCRLNEEEYREMTKKYAEFLINQGKRIIIMSLFKCCSLSYGFILVYVFYPFVTKIKIKYAFFSKIKQIKNILIHKF